MQLHIEVTLTDTGCAGERWQAAMHRVVQVGGLRDADLVGAARDGVLRGVISSERVLELAVMDEVQDFQLAPC